MSERSNAYTALLRDFRQNQADENHHRLDVRLFAVTKEEFDDLDAKTTLFQKHLGAIGRVVLGDGQTDYMLFDSTDSPEKSKALLRFAKLAAVAGEWLPPEIQTALNVQDKEPIDRWLTFMWAQNPPDKSRWDEEQLADGARIPSRPAWDYPCRVAADTIERAGLVNTGQPGGNKESGTPSASKPTAPGFAIETGGTAGRNQAPALIDNEPRIRIGWLRSIVLQSFCRGDSSKLVNKLNRAGLPLSQDTKGSDWYAPASNLRSYFSKHPTIVEAIDREVERIRESTPLEGE